MKNWVIQDNGYGAHLTDCHTWCLEKKDAMFFTTRDEALHYCLFLELEYVNVVSATMIDNAIV